MLKELHLENNSIVTLPEALLINLPFLEILNLEHNRLSEFDWPRFNPARPEIFLSHN